MPNFFNKYHLDQVSHSIGLLLLVFGAIATAVGITLIVRSDVAFRIFRVMNNYISTRRGFRMLAIPRDTRQLAMDYGYWLTGFIVAGAAYSLFVLARLDDAKIAAGLGLDFPLAFVTWLVESARLTLITLSLFSLVIGVMLTFFPHAFSSIEKWLNQWFSPRVLIHFLEQMHLGFDKAVETFPKATGWIILFPASAIFISGMMTF